MPYYFEEFYTDEIPTFVTLLNLVWFCCFSVNRTALERSTLSTRWRTSGDLPLLLRPILAGTSRLLRGTWETSHPPPQIWEIFHPLGTWASHPRRWTSMIARYSRHWDHKQPSRVTSPVIIQCRPFVDSCIIMWIIFPLIFNWQWNYWYLF